MYWNDYMWFMGAMLVCMLLSAFASGKVKTTFAKHDKVRCRSGVTGYDTVWGHPLSHKDEKIYVPDKKHGAIACYIKGIPVRVHSLLQPQAVK